jgi:hypothetical protein
MSNIYSFDIDGNTYEVEADNEEDARALAESNTPSPPNAEPAPSPTATEIGMNQSRERERLKDVPVTRDFGNRNIQSGNLVQAGFTGESLGPENKYQITPREEDEAMGVARYIPTVVSSYLFPIERAGVVTASVIPAVTELITSYSAGDSTPEAVRNSILAAYPGAKIKAIESLLPAVVKETFKEMARISGTIFTAETVSGLIEGKGFSESFKNAIQPSNYTIPAAISAIVGPVRGWSAKSSYIGKRAEEVRNDLLPLLGDDMHVGPGMAMPREYAKLEADFIANNPTHPTTEKLQKLGPDATSRWAQMFPEAKTSADIAQALKPDIESGRQLEMERNNLALLQRKHQEAQQRLAQAQSRNLTEPQMAKIEGEVIASEAALINQEARTSFFNDKSKTLNGSGDAPSTTQKKFVDSTNRLFQSRSRAASAAYKETGVPFNERFIPVDELVASAAAKTKNMNTPARNQMLEKISKAGGESGFISINQMKELRSSFGTDFNSTDQKSIDAFEKIANDMYAAVTKRTQKIVEGRFGKEVGDKLAEVNAWWGETSNLQNSKYMNQMLSGEPGKSLVTSIAQDMQKGNFQSVRGYVQFLNAVARRAPDVADMGKSALINTAREGFVNLAKDVSGNIDRSKLFKSLTAASKYNKELKGVFPIEALGFGNAKQIRAINQTYRQYGLNSMSPEDLDDFYGNPMVREALSSGGDISKLVTKSAARSAFKKRVKEIVALRAVGAKIDDHEYNMALGYAKDAEMSLEAQNALVRELEESSPLARFMSGDDVGIPKSAYSLNESNAITNMIKGMPRKTQDAFIIAVRETDPALLKDIKYRVLMDLLPNVIDGSGVGGHMWKIDMTKVRNMFEEAGRAGKLKDASHPINILEKLMSPDEFIRFKSKMPSFARLSANAQSGGTIGMDFDLRNLGASAMARSTGSNSLSLFRSVIAEIFNLSQGIKYRTAAAMLLDGDVAASVIMSIPLPATKAILLSNDTELQAENMLKQKAP